MELGLDSQRVLLPSFKFILSITLPNFSIQNVPFPALLKSKSKSLHWKSPACIKERLSASAHTSQSPTKRSTLIRRQFQVKSASLLIPIDLILILILILKLFLIFPTAAQIAG